MRKTMATERGDAAADAWPRRIRWLAIALTLALHLMLFDIVRTPPRLPERPATAALEVILIELDRSALPPPPPPMPQSPLRPPSAASAPRPTSRRLNAVTVPAERSDTALPAPPPLFDANARPRLPDDPAPAYTRPDALRADARRGPRTSLPGSAEPIVDIGELRDPPSPQDIVRAVGMFIGLGRPIPTDSCDRIEGRLLSEAHSVVREIDLAAFNRRCRGWR
jgi:hypothetical protein